MNKYAWQEIQLGDYVDLLSGFAFKSKYFTDNISDIPLVKGANVHQGYIDWKKAVRWPKNEYENLEKFHLETGDVVLAMDRPWIEAGLKYSWIKPNDPKSMLVQRVSRMRGIKGLSSRYLRYVIGSPQFTNYIKPIVTGINVPHISGGQIKDYKFSLPSEKCQDEIANILEPYDNLIENNNRRIAILEDIAQSLYQEWFVKFCFPGHQKTKFKESSLGFIPEGWEVKAASEVIDIAPKMSLPKEGAKPFVSMPSISTTSMVIDEIEMREGNSGTKFINGDTLFARITPCLQNGKTGFVQFLDELNPIAYGSTEFIVMRSKELTSEFVYCLARSDSFRGNAINSMAGADGRQRVKNDCFNSYYLAVSPKTYLEQFSEISTPAFEEVFTLNQKNKNLKKQRDMLLPKLISGKIKVS